MPARDPITSPHLPTSGPSTSPQQYQHQTVFSPTSSSFSVRTVPHVSPPDSPIGRIDTGGPSGGSGSRSRTAMEVGSRETTVGRGMTKRKSSGDFDERDPRLSLSTSSQAIRESSNRLASLSFTSSNRPRRVSSSSGTSGETSLSQPSISPLASGHPPAAGVTRRSLRPSHLNPAITPTSTTPSSTSPGDGKGDLPPPKAMTVPGSVGNIGRSGLSVMMDREKAARAAAGPATSPISESPERSPPLISLPTRLDSSSTVNDDGIATPMPRKGSLTPDIDAEHGSDSASDSGLRRYLAAEPAREDVERADENTPLLGKSSDAGLGGTVRHWRQRARKVSAWDLVNAFIAEPVKTLPATVLGLLLNVLDGVSYGMILFPANPVFQDFGSLGVSMFFMSCIVSQLAFSLGGSIFPGGNGSMMIEAVPFFHILVNIIQAEVGNDDRAIIATTLVAFAFSSILTGIVFFGLGAFRLGTLIGYFPRHILVGCIGGVGIFLIETGLEVASGLKEEGFEYNLATLKLFFKSPLAVLLWTIPLGLAVLLRIITHFYHHQLVFPAYFFLIPVIFYTVVSIGRWDLDYLRQTGWVFDIGKNTQAWWKFYTYFDFHKTNWSAFWSAMPTQLALVFFGILHVPLNVPALGVSLSEDNVKLDRELVAHGASNLLAGLTGTVPNYLTYVNTVLFYRVGGGSRLSGVMLAMATAVIMMIGPTVIKYLPVMVVGALIFVLGIDLTIEAVWDTRYRVNRMEYITIWAIAIGMTVWDFVIGLLFGIILACIFFVVQNSRRRAIRAVFSGATAKSTVRRPRSQRAFIQQVGSQTYVMKLQGFLFFGTISAVEEEIRKLLELAKWQHNPIRFLIIDFHLVHGLDFSSAEAFVRVQRLLAAKDVLLIMCGAAPHGLAGSALRAVGLWAARGGDGVEVFAGLNEALEWTENAYLTAFYENQRVEESDTARMIDFPKVARPPFSLAESFQNSPRRSHLAKAGANSLPSPYFPPEPTQPESMSQPLPLLLQTLGSYSAETDEFYQSLVPYFVQTFLTANTTLWRQSDPSDGLYLIESGSLRATYTYGNHTKHISETMVAGTIAGDLSTLSDTARNATVMSEGECVLWKLDREGLERLQAADSGAASRLVKVVLKAVAEEQDVLASHLIAVLS